MARLYRTVFLVAYVSFVNRAPRSRLQIRQWGGALYQRDDFFSEADIRGILIFQVIFDANLIIPV